MNDHMDDWDRDPYEDDRMMYGDMRDDDFRCPDVNQSVLGVWDDDNDVIEYDDNDRFDDDDFDYGFSSKDYDDDF